MTLLPISEFDMTLSPQYFTYLKLVFSHIYNFNGMAQNVPPQIFKIKKFIMNYHDF